MTNQENVIETKQEDLEEKTNGKIYSTKNEYYIEDNVINIVLKNRKNECVGVAKVDAKHSNLVLNLNWWMNDGGYVKTTLNHKKKLLHRLITNEPEGFVIDHLNHDKLDNRDENLRVCTVTQNGRNRERQCGITYRKDLNKWVARIKVDKKLMHIGHYDEYENALKARKQAEIIHFGGEIHE
jgi:hypothetical protein